jgi:hypothetical protein
MISVPLCSLCFLLFKNKFILCQRLSIHTPSPSVLSVVTCSRLLLTHTPRKATLQA